MGKTNKKIVEDKEKAPESPTHKKRRQQQEKLREILRYGVEDDDELETFERIKPRR